MAVKCVDCRRFRSIAELEAVQEEAALLSSLRQRYIVRLLAVRRGGCGARNAGVGCGARDAGVGARIAGHVQHPAGTCPCTACLHPPAPAFISPHTQVHVTSSHMYFVMEHAGGGTLHELLRAKASRLPWSRLYGCNMDS